MEDDTSPEIPTAQPTPLDELRPHPRNYREHPVDQLGHIIASIREHGFYRNVVAARDGTVLAGHGVVAASKELGLDEVPVVKLDVDPDDPAALRVLTGDNAISGLAHDDDRLLTEILRELHADDETLGLLGTGFDDQMLRALAVVTRPANEIEDHDAAAEWLGMPSHDPGADEVTLLIRFRNEEDRDRFFEEKLDGVAPRQREGKLSTWWPEEGRVDLASVVVTDDDGAEALLS